MAEDAVEEPEEENTDSEETDLEAEDSADDDSEEKDSGEEESPEKGSKKKFKLNLSRKMIIIIAASTLFFIVLLTGGIIAWKMMGDDPSEEMVEEALEGTDPETPQTVDFDLPIPDLENILPMEPFVIPLKDDSGDWELNITIELEVANQKTKKEVEKRMDEIREAIEPVLGTRRPNALQNVASKIELRTELIITINKMLKRGKIRNLYFTQFVVM